MRSISTEAAVTEATVVGANAVHDAEGDARVVLSFANEGILYLINVPCDDAAHLRQCLGRALRHLES